MKKLPLHWKIIVGLFLGILWSFLSIHMGWNGFTKNWIAPWGKIFINLLKLIAVPLVLFSIITGVSGLSNIHKLGRVGIKTVITYLLTTVFAIGIGLVLVNTLKPGNHLPEEQRVKNRLSYEIWAKDNNIIINDTKSFLTDPLYNKQLDQAYSQYAKHKDLEKKDDQLQQRKNNALQKKVAGPLDFLVDMIPSNIFLSLTNNKLMLQIIFFALFFSVVLLMLDPEKKNAIAPLVNALNEVFLKMVDIVMKGTPFFVFALMASTLSDLAGDDPEKIKDLIINLGWYSMVVVIGLALMAFVVYPTMYLVSTKKTGYVAFFRSISPAQLLAFSSSSSAATLPVTMECVNDNLKVPKEISSFVLPIGATVNMDGTSLYQAVAVVYLAQMHLIDLTLAQQLVIIGTATLASIGSAAVPSAGLVMLMIVLDAVGLNPAWIAIIFPVDRILDMCRTVVNVTGDATVATVIAKSENSL